MKNIAVIGTGYVGLVASAGLAELGNDVTGVDIDAKRINALNDGRIPIYEPGLEAIIENYRSTARIRFTTDAALAISEADIVYIAVGTPSLGDGSADLSAVRAAAATIATNANRAKVVVLKSTVPVGTAESIGDFLRLRSERHLPVVSNPEFLREGHAVQDFLSPDKIVLGTSDDWAREMMLEVYRPLVERGVRIVTCTNETAELCKYVNNAFLATKVAFINEIADLCNAVRADVAVISEALGLDKRISPAFLNPGPGFGGSCFPKDLRALAYVGRAANVPLRLVEEVLEENRQHMMQVAGTLERMLGGLSGRTVGLLGLAFKADTDDVRESPAIAIATELVRRGARVRAFDPRASENASVILRDTVAYCGDEYQAAEDADALVIATEWDRFRTLDLNRIRQLMKGTHLYDTRNLYAPDAVRQAGLTYLGMGRSDFAVIPRKIAMGATS